MLILRATLHLQKRLFPNGKILSVCIMRIFGKNNFLFTYAFQFIDSIADLIIG